MIQKLLNKKTLPYILTFVAGSALTYVIVGGSTSEDKEYTKTITQQKEQITQLETENSSLKEEITRISSTFIEEFDPVTGNVIRRETRNETETQTRVVIKEVEKIVEVVKEVQVEKIVEKEKIVKEVQKNHVYGGVGLNTDAEKLFSGGYMRTIGIFNVGVQFQANEKFDDKAILGTVGISF